MAFTRISSYIYVLYINRVEISHHSFGFNYKTKSISMKSCRRKVNLRIIAYFMV